MEHILKKLQQLALDRLATRLKHLRGQHDQLDHAWNRGMGQGGGGAALAPNQMGPLPTQGFYRQRLADLTAQRRRGEITRAEMRQQMRDLRGITADTASEDMVLANRRKKPNPNQLAFNFNAPAQPVSTVAQNTASLLVDSIINNTPTKIAEKAKKYSDAKNKLREGWKKYYDSVKAVGKYHWDSYKLLFDIEDNIAKEYELAQQEYYTPESEEHFLKILESLKNPNSQEVNVNVPKTWKKAEKERAIKIIKTTFGMAKELYTTPPTINIVKSRINGAVWYASTRTIKIGSKIKFDDISHETVHAMQDILGFGIKPANDFGKKRTQGESPINLGDYGITTDQEKKSFLDATDNIYTFKQYSWESADSFPEILTTSIDSMLQWGSLSDRELMELTMDIIMNGG